MGNHRSLEYFLVGFTFLLCGTISQVFSQQGSLLFHHLTQEDGLSELSNQFVYKDSKGFIWISSINGLNRFDGTHVKRYFPNPADSTSIFSEILQSDFFEDDSTHLWFGTWKGINEYDRKHDRFYHTNLTDSLHKPRMGYQVIHIDSLNQLWMIVASQFIYSFNVHSKEFQLVSHLKVASQRAMAIANPAGQVRSIFSFILNVPGVEKVDFDLNGKIIKDTILWTGIDGPVLIPSEIIAEGDSILWIAGEDELVKYNLATLSINRTKIKDILSIELYNDSLLLVSINNQGVWEFNKSTFALGYQYMPENGNPLSLLTNTINYMSMDRDHGIWLCSAGFGLSYAYPGKRKFNLYNPVSIRETENSKFNPNGFIPDAEGRVLCSTIGGGIYVLDRNCRIYKSIPGLDVETNSRFKAINKVFKDKINHIWVSSYLGLSIISDQYENIHHVSDQSGSMLDGIALHDGRILFTGATGGLYEAVSMQDVYELKRIKPDQLNKGYAPIQQDSRGRIWMSENLVKFIILESSSFDSISEIQIDGICNPIIESQDAQTIWIASSTGLYDIDANNLVIRKVYNEATGLPSAGLNSMLMDTTGKLWLSCAKGLIVFNPKTDSSIIYNYEDGVPSSTFNSYGAYRFNDGEMWFGSSSGITKFYPDQIRNIRIGAVPQITSMLINGKLPARKLVCEKTQSTNITETEKLTFTYRENTLTFMLNSLEYSAPRRNKVRYKMENFDADWEETNSGSEVRYHLRPGSYSLLVKAANSDGVYSNTVRKLDITIKPPFYATWWFITLCALVVLGIAVYIVYLNFSKKLELQKVRLRLYENLHDDVGSRLTAIVLSAEELIQQDQVVHPKLQHIAKVSKSIVNNMRRLVWAIDPENDSMNSLVQKVQYDKSLILDDKIGFNIETDPHLKQWIVPGEIRYQVMSIISEALNNISKYAQAKNVWIQFNKKENDLHLAIKDDGIGFNVEATSNDKVRSSGYGLGNMQKRITRVKGKLQIHSKPGEGTLIEVRIPM